MSDTLLDSLATAVAGSPEDAELRALYAARLADAGRRDEAIGQALVVEAKQPGHAGAQALLRRLTGAGSGEGSAPTASTTPVAHSTETPGRRIVGYQPHGQGDGPIYAREEKKNGTPGGQVPDGQAPGVAVRGGGPAGDQVGRPDGGEPAPGQDAGVDWHRLENEVASPVPPPFVVHNVVETPVGVVETLSEAEDSSSPAEVTRESLKLSDVGGLIDVKQRIREAFLDPIAHPEIAKAFKQSLSGGLLLYGPPGCGKTYLARAIAGELGAHFVSVTLADVLSKWLGESEENIHKTFTEARRKTPAVLFLDEVDAVGGKRSSQNSQGLRNVVNQLLMEMDGVGNDNDGLFVLAATNMPWDVDPALLRPGRFDRMVLVSPPDEPAREAILRGHLEQRPIQGIDLDHLVRHTSGFSGADLKHLCDTAAEKALAASIKSGTVQPISMSDMSRALKEVKPSIGPWLDSARNVASYANADGRYDDLVQLLKRFKRL